MKFATTLMLVATATAATTHSADADVATTFGADCSADATACATAEANACCGTFAQYDESALTTPTGAYTDPQVLCISAARRVDD